MTEAWKHNTLSQKIYEYTMKNLLFIQSKSQICAIPFLQVRMTSQDQQDVLIMDSSRYNTFYKQQCNHNK